MNAIRTFGSRPSVRKVIAVDIDEVLCPFFRPLLKWRKVNPTSEKYPYRFKDVMNISETHSKRLVEKFYRSNEFKTLEPIQGSQNGMAYLKGLGYKVYAVSGRQSVARGQTEEWIQQHFPYTIDDVILTNSFTKHNIPKVDMCHALGANIIIDDNTDICNECTVDGIRALNFIGDPVYPWCAENPRAVQSWTDVTLSMTEIESEPSFLGPGTF